jgi:hypothetical protein
MQPDMEHAARALLRLRERIHRTVVDESRDRWKRFLEQLRELALHSAPPEVRMRARARALLRLQTVTLERTRSDDAESSVELLACRLIHTVLAHPLRSTVALRPMSTDAASSLTRLRAEARALFCRTKADLWSTVVRRSVLEASRTACALAVQGQEIVERLRRALEATAEQVCLDDDLAHMAEQVALHEMLRLLARPACAAASIQ